MTIYMIEKHSDYLKDAPLVKEVMTDFGYLVHKDTALEIADAKNKEAFEQWAAEKHRMAARAKETYYYPELRTREEEILIGLLGVPVPDFKEQDTSKHAYLKSVHCTTYHVLTVEPCNQ